MQGVIGLNTIYDLVRSGRIKSVRVTRKILIPRQELLDFPEREANRAP
jgi:excisionase family DNA binding protein